MQYNTETKTITINHSFSFLDKNKSEFTAELNNMPEDAEILNIDKIRIDFFIKLGNVYTERFMSEDAEVLNIEQISLTNGSINNLPPTLKEINIKYDDFWYRKDNDNNSFIVPLSFFGAKERKELLKKIFPKRPYGCKIYLID
jgi:hypothetical protein